MNSTEEIVDVKAFGTDQRVLLKEREWHELVETMWVEMHANPYTIDQVAESFDRHEWIKSRMQELGITSS